MIFFPYILSDFVLLRPSILAMKEEQLCLLREVVGPETYLGARMNEKALLFHTQLHDWSEAQKLSAQAAGHTRLINSARQKEVFLPVKKLSQIEYWTRDVNKYYSPRRPGTGKSGNFMYIDVSKYNMHDAGKTETQRPKSAFVRSSPRSDQRPVSAITTNSVPKRRFFGTDLSTVHNHLIECQLHYTGLRRALYSDKSLGPPITANTVTAPTKESLKNLAGPKSFSTGTYNESETISNIGNSVGSKVSDQESQGQGVTTQQQLMQPVISSRSWSNKMLNVISIDDCKLTCRYRPQKIKEARGPTIDFQELDKKALKSRNNEAESKSDLQDGHETQPDSYAASLQAKGTNSKELVPLACKDGHADADDEDESENELDINHLSPDRNNNDIVQRIVITEATPRNDSDSSQQYLPNIEQNNTVSVEDKKEIITESLEGADDVFVDGTAKNTSEEILLLKSQEIKLANDEVRDIMNSQGEGTSKTSYGRLTTLYSNSDTTKKSKPEKKKKITRTQRITHAIDDMVEGRKVMNSMTKDFDKRIGEYGRTVIDKHEGSDTFKKMHSHLRRKIGNYMEYKGAMKTKQFHEKRRLNSSSSINSVEREV